MAMTTSPLVPSAEPPSQTDLGSVPPPSDEATKGLFGGLIKTIRPHQWVKNVFVFAPIVFARSVFDPAADRRAIGAVVVFCFLSGAVYTLNDLVDVEADRVHPKKRHRPIASGRVPERAAKIFLACLVAGSLGAAWIFFRHLFFITALAYFLGNIAYSFKLKHVPFLDVLCIAGFFTLRVLGGGYAIGVQVSNYMFACTFLLALFLGLGKRRHEVGQVNAGKQRKALEGYTLRGLDLGLGVTATATLATYVAYTLSQEVRVRFGTSELWMTTPSVVNGIARFLQIVRGPTKSESPTQEMLRDPMFLVNVVAWIAVMFALIYKISVR